MLPDFGMSSKVWFLLTLFLFRLHEEMDKDIGKNPLICDSGLPKQSVVLFRVDKSNTLIESNPDLNLEY